MKFLNLIACILISSIIAKNAQNKPKDNASVEQTENKLFLQQYEELLKNPEARPSNSTGDNRRFLDPYPNSNFLPEDFARKMLDHAAASYCPRNQLENWSCYNCVKGTWQVIHVSNRAGDLAGYVGVQPKLKKIIVSYRGTNNLANWLTNLNFGFVNVKSDDYEFNPQVHEGFWQGTSELYTATKRAVADLKANYPNYQIVFTGHSLGAALADVMAYRFGTDRVLKWEDIWLVTFGGPRVGDRDFALLMNSKPISVARVTNTRDIVPDLPPRKWDYAHHQYNIHINEGRTVHCSYHQEDKNCLNDYIIPQRDAHFRYWDMRMNTACRSNY